MQEKDLIYPQQKKKMKITMTTKNKMVLRKCWSWFLESLKHQKENDLNHSGKSKSQIFQKRLQLQIPKQHQKQTASDQLNSIVKLDRITHLMIQHRVFSSLTIQLKNLLV